MSSGPKRQLGLLGILLPLGFAGSLWAQTGRTPSPPEIARQADAFIAAQRYAEAEERLQALVRNERYLLAEQPLARWVSDQPENARARFMLGYCLMRQFRSQDAEPHLAEAARLNPRRASWMHAYAMALNLNGKNRTALEVLQRAQDVELRPELLFATATCQMSLGEPEAAEKTLHTFLAASPEHAQGHYKLGQVLTEQGRYAEALAPLRRALEIEPDQVEALYLLGLAESRAGDDARAVAAYEAVIATVPHHVGALYNLGRVLARMGERDEGRRYLERFREASFLEDQLKFWRKMVKNEPTHVEKRLELSTYLLRAGLAEEALKNLQAAQARAPRNPRIYRSMAEALRRLGRHADARRSASFATILEVGGQ